MRRRRNVVRIDEEKCDGCGQCVSACVEGAIELVDGKARLVSDVYCDGLGACIGECPRGAITVEEREAEEFDESAVKRRLANSEKEKAAAGKEPLPCGCPGTMAKRIQRPVAGASPPPDGGAAPVSRLGNWPVQLKLISPGAPYLNGADLILSADCAPFAFADFHGRFLGEGKVLAVGCPKLDDAGYYIDKLADILEGSSVRSLTVLHMEVPCCAGLVGIAEAAIERSGAEIAFSEVTIGIGGEVIEEERAPVAG